MKIKPQSNIAIIPAKGLGDGLVQMVLAYPLAKDGHRVTFMHHFLFQMRSFFPAVDIWPSTDNIEKLKQFDRVIILDYDTASKVAPQLPNCLIPPKQMINKKISMLDNIVNIGRTYFELETITKENGIKIPGNLIHQKYQRRIIIHPTSTDESKNWPAKKFINLARELKQNHFDPIFIVSPKEQCEWKKMIGDEFEMPLCETIDALARYIYESKAMIGNDSGIGHLASNLGLPTFSIFSSEKRAWLWRPGWCNNTIITPEFKLPGKYFKNSWKWSLTVQQVLMKFMAVITQQMISRK